MLEAIGVSSVAELLEAVPAHARDPRLGVPAGLSEADLFAELSQLAALDRPAGSGPFFLGAGVYRRYIPAAVPLLATRGEFLTAYTPYQAEVSQGTLQAIWEYQSLVAELLDMDVANASLYDGSTAVAEAAMLAVRATGRHRVVVSHDVHPHHRQILRTYAQGPGMEIVEVRGAADLVSNAAGAACLVVANPSFFGTLVDLRAVAEAAHAAGALAIAVIEPVSCALLEPPGACQIDVAVGDGQPLGIPMSFGGPYVGIMATRRELVRQMPGRIVGQTRDSAGTRGFVNTLQTREQHIRREKATSNICTAQALNALAGVIYLSWLGRRGLVELGELLLQRTAYARSAVAELDGVELLHEQPVVREFAVRLDAPVDAVIDRCAAEGVNPGFPLEDDGLLIAITEQRSREDIDRLVSVLGAAVAAEREPAHA